MTVFIHTGDWQIGKPYGKVSDPAKRVQLQRARLEAIGRIRKAVLAHQAAMVLVVGDLFDAEILPTNTLLEVLQAIGEFNVPRLVIPGNHDHGARAPG
jgi:DNA repair exonuclease SbcCD nuclease subunit